MPYHYHKCFRFLFTNTRRLKSQYVIHILYENTKIDSIQQLCNSMDILWIIIVLKFVSNYQEISQNLCSRGHTRSMIQDSTEREDFMIRSKENSMWKKQMFSLVGGEKQDNTATAFTSKLISRKSFRSLLYLNFKFYF